MLPADHLSLRLSRLSECRYSAICPTEYPVDGFHHPESFQGYSETHWTFARLFLALICLARDKSLPIRTSPRDFDWNHLRPLVDRILSLHPPTSLPPLNSLQCASYFFLPFHFLLLDSFILHISFLTAITTSHVVHLQRPRTRPGRDPSRDNKALRHFS